MKIKKEISIIDIVSILLAASVFGYTIYQDIRIKNLEYRNKSADTKPILELIEQPKIYVEKILLAGNDYVDYPIVDTMVIGVDIEIRQVMKLKNIGNEKAIIITEIFSDTITGADYIRERFNNKKGILNKFVEKNIDDYFIDRELLPGDTIIIEDGRRIGMDLITNEFVNHFLIVYDNSFGNRYDTYIKSKFKLNQPLFNPIFNPITGALGFKVYKKTQWDFFEMSILPNRTTKIYTKKEKKFMDKIIDNLKYRK